MKTILSEKNIVVILFVMVLITFSLAQEETKKLEKMYIGATAAGASKFLVNHSEAKKTTIPVNAALPADPVE
jgi:hypothetical protein